jgi:DNA-binding SARP family transcriptional activator
VSLSIHLLGPLTVSVDGRPIRSWRPKQRHVIALLAARPGRSVSIDVLVDEVWRGEPPEAARPNLRTYVAAIRSAVGIGHAVATTSNGYRWDLAPDATDIGRIATLADEARACGDHDPAGACRRWDAAVRLIDRGRPFDDVPDGGYLDGVRDALSARFTAVREERFEAYVDAGRGSEIVSELVAYVRDHPLREQAHAQFVRALHASGDTAAALAAYRSAHRTLSAELGIEPGPALRTALASVLHAGPRCRRTTLTTGATAARGSVTHRGPRERTRGAGAACPYGEYRRPRC